MNKVVAAKDQLLAKFKKFEEYANMSSNFDAMREAEMKIAEGQNSAFAILFPAFAEAQPPEIGNGLKSIGEAGANQAKISQQRFDDSMETRNGLNDLKAQYDSLQHEHQELEKALDRAKKTKQKEQQCESAVSRAQIKGAAEVAKAEANLNVARSQANDAQKQAEQMQDKYTQDESEYRVKFIQSLATTMSEHIDRRIKSLNEEKPIAQDILAAVQTFAEYTDAVIPTLEQRLQDFENETIE